MDKFLQAAANFALPEKIDIGNILNGLTTLLRNLSIPLGVLFIIFAAFKLIFARGDERKVKEAQIMILWILIGVALAYFAKDLIEIIISMVAGGGQGPQPMDAK